MKTAKDYVHGHSAIVFDLDGTLLHTEPDIRQATNQALLDCGFQTLAPTQVIPNLYGTLPDILASVMALVQAPAVAADDLQQAYLAHYAREGRLLVSRASPFSGQTWRSTRGLSSTRQHFRSTQGFRQRSRFRRRRCPDYRRILMRNQGSKYTLGTRDH